MNWFTQLFSKRRAAALAVSFDTTGWTLVTSDDTRAEWTSAAGDTLSARVDTSTDEASAAAADIESLRTMHRAAAAANGEGIVAVERLRIGRVSGVLAITKAANGASNIYTGTITLPLTIGTYTVAMKAGEQGISGIREAVVTSTLGSLGKLQFTPAEPGQHGKIEGWLQDPYDAEYSGPTLCSVVDDERLNSLFVQHPLTKVRRWVAQVEHSLAIDDHVIADVATPSLPEGRESQRRHLLPTEVVGAVFLTFKQYATAEKYLAEAARDYAGKNDIDAAASYELLGKAHHAQRALDRAEESLGKSCTLYERALGADDPRTANARCVLATVILAGGRLDDAEVLFGAALEGSQRAGNSRRIAVSALQGLGLIRLRQHRSADSIDYLERALAMLEQSPRPDENAGEMVLRSMAYAFTQMGDRSRAADAWQRAEAIKRRREERRGK